jgi:late competence protein required for DNA uptake (superfamily II DNA/RNA helicase)
MNYLNMGLMTLHPDTENDLKEILNDYKAYSSNIRNLNAIFKCEKCGKITEKNMLQLQRRPKLLCRQCYMIWKYGVKNISCKEEIKHKKRDSRRRRKSQL